MKRTSTILALGVAVVLLSGCVMKPKGAPEMEKALEKAGEPYVKPFEKRTLPELPQPAEWRDVLYRGLLANGEVESAYFEWSAAVQRITEQGAWPNSNVQLGADYQITPSNMKAWDRTTLSLGFDSAMNLSAPIKIRKQAQVAYQAADEAAERFRAAKFKVQRQILTQYLDLARMQEQVRIQQENLKLLKLLVQNAKSRVQAGAPQQDLLKAQLELRSAEAMLQGDQAQVSSMRAMLNGMLSRDAQAPLVLPTALPAPRELLATDDRLIAMAVDGNPELAALAAQVRGRSNAIELAKMKYIPDISPNFTNTGDISRSIGAMVVLPTTIPLIEATIRETQAMLRSSQAMLRQTRSDRAASFVATLYILRNDEKQHELFEARIMLAAREVLRSARAAYSSGSVGYVELVEAQRTVLNVQLQIVNLYVDREKRLAELEELAGVDMETLAGKAATRPTTMPATMPAIQSTTMPTTQPAQG